MRNIILFTLVTLLSSCASLKKDQSVTYWVNSYKTQGTGVGPMECLLIQKGDSISDKGWTNFYGRIEGFEYQPGYIFKLKVKEEQLDPSSVPADASSIKYTLIKVEEKNQDLTLNLNDIWLLTSIGGEAVDRNSIKKPDGIPILEIHIANQRVLGTDGCNQYNGSLKKLTQTEIEFGPLMGTKMMCSEMHIADSYNVKLAEVKSYILENMTLTFFDANNEELMTFKKID